MFGEFVAGDLNGGGAERRHAGKCGSGERLLQLGSAIQSHLRPIVAAEEAGAVEPVAEQAGDAIYPLDRHVEHVLEGVIHSWPDSCKPLLLIAEGMGADGRLRFGPSGRPLR